MGWLSTSQGGNFTSNPFSSTISVVVKKKIRSKKAISAIELALMLGVSLERNGFFMVALSVVDAPTRL